ncbi:MAG: transketolase [Bacteroidota bacterium]
MSLTLTEKNDLLVKSINIKKRFITMYYKANAGHIGSSLSCAEILTYIHFKLMTKQDELILSKGHAAASLYSLLAEGGILSEKDIDTFYKNGTYLAAHPPANKINKIPFATGSLGHGLSIAAGFGFAGKLKKNGKQAFVVCSDGELNEGSTWEAALFICHHNLNNVVLFIDRNKLQGFGSTEDIMKMDPLQDKLLAFGFDVLTIDGHDFSEFETIKAFRESAKKPVAVICNTIKGNGWVEQENKLACHYIPFKQEEYENIMASFNNELASIKNH